MHEMEEGASVGVRGPFGKGFPVDTEMLGSDIVFICGGIGLVPVRSAIQYVLQHRYDYGDVAIVYGTKTPAEQLFLGELAQWEQSEEVKFLQTVDRASPEWKKRVGVITTLIPELAVKSESTKVIVCGPPIMYKFVIMELSAIGIPDDQIYVSLERRMKCGVGRCGHCQINELYTCLDGPVFKYAQVKDAPEAI
jgi:NAD(P)H-flavin reductase